jgi:hypothetical protein
MDMCPVTRWPAPRIEPVRASLAGTDPCIKAIDKNWSMQQAGTLDRYPGKSGVQELR